MGFGIRNNVQQQMSSKIIKSVFNDLYYQGFNQWDMALNNTNGKNVENNSNPFELVNSGMSSNGYSRAYDNEFSSSVLPTNFSVIYRFMYEQSNDRHIHIRLEDTSSSTPVLIDYRISQQDFKLESSVANAMPLGLSTDTWYWFRADFVKMNSNYYVYGYYSSDSISTPVESINWSYHLFLEQYVVDTFTPNELRYEFYSDGDNAGDSLYIDDLYIKETNLNPDVNNTFESKVFDLSSTSWMEIFNKGFITPNLGTGYLLAFESKSILSPYSFKNTDSDWSALDINYFDLSTLDGKDFEIIWSFRLPNFDTTLRIAGMRFYVDENNRTHCKYRIDSDATSLVRFDNVESGSNTRNQDSISPIAGTYAFFRLKSVVSGSDRINSLYYNVDNDSATKPSSWTKTNNADVTIEGRSNWGLQEFNIELYRGVGETHLEYLEFIKL